MASRLTFVESQHTYWLADAQNGRRARVPSVSALRNTLYQFAGERWYLREAGEALADIWGDLEGMAPPLRADALTQAAKDRINYGRNFGTAVHHYCEQLWGGEPQEIPEEYAAHVQAVADYWRMHDLKLMSAEAMMYADADEIGTGAMAGRLDLLVLHPDRGLGLVDLKTWTSRSSGQVRTPEWAFQLAAYSTMDALVDRNPDTGEAHDIPMPRVNWLAVWHVGPSGLRAYQLSSAQWELAVQQVDTARALKALKAAEMEEVGA